MNFERQEIKEMSLTVAPAYCLEDVFRLQHNGVTQTKISLAEL